jgi:hypothetical protein
VIRSIFWGTTIVHLVLLPILFTSFELQEYFLYSAAIQLLVALTFVLVSYRKGYK